MRERDEEFCFIFKDDQKRKKKCFWILDSLPWFHFSSELPCFRLTHRRGPGETALWDDRLGIASTLWIMNWGWGSGVGGEEGKMLLWGHDPLCFVMNLRCITGQGSAGGHPVRCFWPRRPCAPGRGAQESTPRRVSPVPSWCNGLTSQRSSGWCREGTELRTAASLKQNPLWDTWLKQGHFCANLGVDRWTWPLWYAFWALERHPPRHPLFLSYVSILKSMKEVTEPFRHSGR